MAFKRPGAIEANNGKDVIIVIKEYTLPDNIDAYIMSGIKKGKRMKRAKAVSKITGIAAVVLITLFMGAVRVSPVFAAYASEIPGLEYIVKLISDDKGLQSAVDNDFIQRVDKSEEADNIVFTVKDIIVDSANLIVFYSIENKGGYKWPAVHNIKLLNTNGENLKVSVSYGSSPSDEKVVEGKITYIFINEEYKPNFVLPDNIIISTGIAVHNEENDGQPRQTNSNVFEGQGNNIRILDHQYKIPVTIDQSRFMNSEKVFQLGHTIEVEGQKITFNSIRILPTRLEIDIAFAPENSMKIFAFEDLKVIDGKGREWGTIMNGVSGTYPDDNRRILYFQSNYFTAPKELYMTGSSLRALDKSKLQVKVDLEGKKFMEAPDDKLTLTGIKQDSNFVAFFYSLNSQDEHRHYNVFSTNAYDGNSIKLKSKSSSGSTGSNMGIQEGDVVFEFSSQLTGPVTLDIEDYPNRISSPFRIDILK